MKLIKSNGMTDIYVASTLQNEGMAGVSNMWSM